MIYMYDGCGGSPLRNLWCWLGEEEKTLREGGGLFMPNEAGAFA